ncbi:MAG: DUF58 domain-containing protein [Myxococcota bacterium]
MERTTDPDAPPARASTRGSLAPETVERVAALELRVREAVEGLLSGMHRSPHRGASVVFVEHREYRPGDDPRLLDWRVFARTDRHGIKRFEQETQLEATLVLDRSASMRWDGLRPEEARGTAKDVHAMVLLGALAHLLHRQGDAVGFLGFDDEPHEDALPPRRRPAHLDALLAALFAARPPAPATDLSLGIAPLAERRAPRGVVVLASDLLDERPGALAPLARLRARGHQVLVLHVLHPDEMDLGQEAGAARVEGLEGEAHVEANLDAVREAYGREVQAFIERSRRRCLAAGARHVLARTDEAPEVTLARALLRGGL